MTLQFSYTEQAYFVWVRRSATSKSYVGQIRAAGLGDAVVKARTAWGSGLEIKAFRHGRTLARA